MRSGPVGVRSGQSRIFSLFQSEQNLRQGFKRESRLFGSNISREEIEIEIRTLYFESIWTGISKILHAWILFWHDPLAHHNRRKPRTGGCWISPWPPLRVFRAASAARASGVCGIYDLYFLPVHIVCVQKLFFLISPLTIPISLLWLTNSALAFRDLDKSQTFRSVMFSNAVVERRRLVEKPFLTGQLDAAHRAVAAPRDGTSLSIVSFWLSVPMITGRYRLPFVSFPRYAGFT